MRIKTRRPAEDLGGDLIFLQRNARVFDRVIGEVTKEFAESLGTVERMTVYQPLYLEKTGFYIGYMTSNAHLTKRNKPISLLAS
jgi:hypothetical protein